MNDNVKMDMMSPSPSGTPVGLDNYITAMTDEEFDQQILQLRRVKAENVRLITALRDAETSLVRGVDPALLNVIYVPSVYEHTDHGEDAITAVEEKVSRCYAVGKEGHELKIQGYRQRMASYVYYETWSWQCVIKVEYRGLKGKAFNEGRYSEFPWSRQELEYGEHGLLEILRFVAADLKLGEKVDLETKLDLIKLFWGEGFLKHYVREPNPVEDEDGFVDEDVSFREFLIRRVQTST